MISRPGLAWLMLLALKQWGPGGDTRCVATYDMLGSSNSL
jgi:hypothetical protein